MLDNTQLGPSQVSVSSAAGLEDLATSAKAGTDEHHEGDIAQEDKPRSRIVAEYLAHGYVLSDNAIQQAITLDKKHGVSSRFTSALANFDSKYKATDKVKGIDSSYGISEKAATGWRGMSSYFEKALGTPTGQKLASFYTQSDKQVRDIHNEARRLADLKTGAGKGSGTADGSNALRENEKNLHNVAGTEKTTCTCGGDDGTCPCAKGKCACNGCSKNNAPATSTGSDEKVTYA